MAEAFAQERQALLALPPNEFPVDECLPVEVGKPPYVRFDSNDYSVPQTCVRRTLVVVADLSSVRVLDGAEVVASHPRSYSHGEQIEAVEHIDALVATKRSASEHHRLDRLHRAIPRTQALLMALAQRGDKLPAGTAALLRLLDLYGASALDRAVAEALAKNVETDLVAGALAAEAARLRAAAAREQLHRAGVALRHLPLAHTLEADMARAAGVLGPRITARAASPQTAAGFLRRALRAALDRVLGRGQDLSLGR